MFILLIYRTGITFQQIIEAYYNKLCLYSQQGLFFLYSMVLVGFGSREFIGIRRIQIRNTATTSARITEKIIFFLRRPGFKCVLDANV